MKEKVENLKNEMLNSYKELEEFKNKNSINTGFFTELIISLENQEEYDRLVKKVDNSRINFELENINYLYNEVIKKCKFISKKDAWFIEYTECVLENNESYGKYKRGDKFNNNYGLFNGLTMETFESYSGELPREDGEVCPFSEFYIYDDTGNEISELTLEEYEILINSEQK